MKAADDGFTEDRLSAKGHRPAEELSSGRFPTGQFTTGQFTTTGPPVPGDDSAPSDTKGTRSSWARGGRVRDSELGLDDHDRTRAIPPPPLRATTANQQLAPEHSGWSAIGAPATPPAAPTPGTPRGPRLRVDWPNCKAHGLCYELLPEAIRLDEWGYPIVRNQSLPSPMVDDARRAVTACPTLALRLVE